VIYLVFVICYLLIAHIKLRQNGIVSFPIKLAAFQASAAADTRNLNTAGKRNLPYHPFGVDQSRAL
jgi:hypothetical protein